ncbi:MAG: lytic transglycosylase domain-containing protein [Burkholderiales bacterium]|nr:lytic transglycosylase domain-containing protein [Burkholderiales bacterium]
MLSRMAKAVMDLTHNSIALVGLSIAAIALVLFVRDDLRDLTERHALTWLLERQEAKNDGMPVLIEPQAADRATAALPDNLPKPQANVAFWLSRKYSVAPEPLSALVAEAFHLGEKIKLDPTLILAVMAIESRFNPFSQSSYGAQGLMQVLTRVHVDKYEDFGGKLAAFDPVTNLRVGVQVLLDCVRKAGSVEGGLKLYVGAVATDGSDYVTKVMAEHMRLRDVAAGKKVPVIVPTVTNVATELPKLPTLPRQPSGVDAESAKASDNAMSAS